MSFTKRQRENLARVFLNLSQAVFIGLIIGRIATPERITFDAFIRGLILFLVLLILGILIDRGE